MKKTKKSYSYKTITPLESPYVEYAGKKMLDFSSCDYLGLSQHPDVRKNAIRYVLKYGVGSLSCQTAPQQQLEEKLARYLGHEKAVLYASTAEAKEALAAADFKETLKQADDTETFGILGEKGFGSKALAKGIDLLTGSLIKGGGCPLAYIACSAELQKELPRSGSISPALLGALDAILNFLPDMESERTQVLQHAGWLAKQLKELGYEVSSALPSFSLRFESAEEKEKALQLFREGEIFAAEPSETEIGISVTALHTPDDLDQLAIALKKLPEASLAFATQSATPAPKK